VVFVAVFAVDLADVVSAVDSADGSVAADADSAAGSAVLRAKTGLPRWAVATWA
jgi:hypothetical protein